jgi:hypothetical protein
MRDNIKYFPVNWVDGMKINKDHFIEQDNAWRAVLQDLSAVHVSPLRYGILPVSVSGDAAFNVKISLDNQESLRVAVLSCNAVTSGGARIIIPAAGSTGQAETGNTLTATFPFSSSANESYWWIFLTVNPYEKQPAGSPDLSESPPRFPHVLPTYTIQLISENNYREFAWHPYSLAIGKVAVNGKDIRIENDYLPPCFSISAHADLVSLHGELDKFLANIELFASRIVQNIFKKNQQNEISELVMFLCDRVMLYIGQAITSMRWTMLHEPPAAMFAAMSNLARVMKNSIDMRTGSGKDELMNYLTEWCELKQGELETMLGNLANADFDNNDINQNIDDITAFVKVTFRLFETLSKLEFIGKRKEGGIFVKEEKTTIQNDEVQAKPRRRFFD